MNIDPFLLGFALLVLVLALTLEDEAARAGDLWWAAHFAERAARAADDAWEALGVSHG